MRIVYLTHYAKMYGANRSMLNLIEGLITKGVTPLVLTPEKGELTQYLAGKNIPFQHVNFYTELYYMRGFSRLKGLQRHLLNKRAFHSVKEIISAAQPDIVHTNTSGLHIGAQIAHALDLPHVWHIREFGELDYRQKFNMGRKNFLKWLNRSRKIIAISNAIKQKAVPEAKAPVDVIYNGVMPAAQMSPKNMEEGMPYDFLIIGALQPEKGQETAIRSFRKICKTSPESTLAIVGDSPKKEYTQFLKNLCQSLGIEKNVTFTGYVADPYPYYHQSKILLMCSQHEAMGRTTAEAMALGMPVIGFDGGATPELVENGETGLLYRNSEELEANMLALLHNPENMMKMGRAGFEKARHMFSVESCSQAMMQVYEECLR